jgi:hypothetical protein
VKVSDGVKVAAGWMLFKWLFGIVAMGVIAIVVALLASANSTSAYQTSSDGTPPRILDPDQREARWLSRCRVRRAPNLRAQIVGHVDTGRTYTVLLQDGPWRKIAAGWVGCPPE